MLRQSHATMLTSFALVTSPGTDHVIHMMRLLSMHVADLGCRAARL